MYVKRCLLFEVIKMVDIPTFIVLIFLIVYIITALTFVISWLIFMYCFIRLYYLLIITKGAWKKAHRWYVVPTWNNLIFRLDRDFSDKKIIYYNNKAKRWFMVMMMSIVVIAIFITIILLFGLRYITEFP